MEMPVVMLERLTDAVDAADTRARVWAFCDGVDGKRRWHDGVSVLGAFESQFRRLLEDAGWRLAGKGRDARWLCPQCAKGAAA